MITGCHCLPRSAGGPRQEVARVYPRWVVTGAKLRGAQVCHDLRNALFGLAADGRTRKMSQLVYLGRWNLKTRKIGQGGSSPGNCCLSLRNQRVFTAIIVRVELAEVVRTHFVPSLLPSLFPDDLKSLLVASPSRQGPGLSDKVELQTSLTSLFESSSAALLWSRTFISAGSSPPCPP